MVELAQAGPALGPFDARMGMPFSSDRLYRVYVRRSALIFIRVGGQSWGHHLAVHFGLLYALYLALTSKRKRAREAALRAELDALEPEALVERHVHNFVLPFDQVARSSLEPRTFFGLYGPHVGKWKLARTDGKQLTLQFDDATALALAVDALGATALVNHETRVELDPRTRQFRARKPDALGR